MCGIREPTKVIIDQNVLSIVPASRMRKFETENLLKKALSPNVNEQFVKIKPRKDNEMPVASTPKRKEGNKQNAAKKFKHDFDESDLLEPPAEPNALDKLFNDSSDMSDTTPSFLQKFTKEELRLLNEFIEKTKIDDNTYKCSKCGKIENERHKMHHHLKNEHMKKFRPKKPKRPSEKADKTKKRFLPNRPAAKLDFYKELKRRSNVHEQRTKSAPFNDPALNKKNATKYGEDLRRLSSGEKD
jgi:hypothetical protein